MKRRTFLQLTGATAAGAVVAGCQSGNEKLIPFLVPPDEGVTPGLATYYASACRACPAGCGILIRVADGRARKIEGNPHHPVNQGKLCARGQAALQELYHPDRVRQPLKRSGPRGSGEFVPVTWAAALDLLTAELKTLQQAGTGDRLALLTPPLRGTLAELTARFMGAFGSPHHLAYELLGPDWLRAATRRNFGQPSLPYYDLAETRYLLSFGAEFIDHHLSPVHYGAAFGRMRQGRNTVRGHFTFVGGRLSLTGASADRWLPARPGSEGALALGMARLILEESRHDATALAAAGLTRETLLAELADWELPQVAEATGLTAEAIAEVAREFAATPPAVAMVGEAVAWQSNGADRQHPRGGGIEDVPGSAAAAGHDIAGRVASRAGARRRDADRRRSGKRAGRLARARQRRAVCASHQGMAYHRSGRIQSGWRVAERSAGDCVWS
jgi:anaerobic selenocysteine-containing dehydrogenase